MYDVVFLGSGHSCWHGALALAAAGKKVAIVDGDLPGGTCTNYGCDAKIILDGPFEFVEGLERYRDLCVEGNGKIDWRKLMAYKRQVLEPFPQALPAIEAIVRSFVFVPADVRASAMLREEVMFDTLSIM